MALAIPPARASHYGLTCRKTGRCLFHYRVLGRHPASRGTDIIPFPKNLLLSVLLFLKFYGFYPKNKLNTNKIKEIGHKQKLIVLEAQ